MLCGEKIFLRLMEERDIPDKVRWVNDPEIRKILISDLISESGTKTWFLKASASHSRKEFIICLNESNESIGFTSIKNIDRTNLKAEMSLLLGNKEYWGHGYAKEARKLLLDYAFNELGLNRIYTFNWVKNGKIISLNKKLGFIIEGELRQDIFFNGEFRNMVIMSILKKEWQKNQ
jgi:RimJ/RimL family protein N-acetyltransferase